eukprot:365747-Chlamydomonas_euryale.AAC.11
MSLTHRCSPLNSALLALKDMRSVNLQAHDTATDGFRSGTARMYQNADGTLPDNGLAIGVANFKKEFNAIRHSIRDDEFARISEANPARTIFGKIGYGIGSGAIAILAGIDKALESAGLLNKLQPEADLSIDQPEDMDSSNCDEVQARLKLLKLSNRAVWDREYAREAAGAGVETPWFVRGVYLSLCVFLDFMFENRPIQVATICSQLVRITRQLHLLCHARCGMQRFWFLETVARMPYFSYISVLHLYESLGWWRAGAVLRKVHFAEEWNELHHLQIMESLGGDQLWIDRFVAMHSSIVYYWILVIMYIVNPKLAYNFSELIEAHAVDTYGEFVDANPSILRELPPPVVAAQYYSSNDLYLFEEFQTSEEGARRRPKCSNLYDVFSNIRDDEGEHVKTMRACQDMTVVNELSERNMRSRKLWKCLWARCHAHSPYEETFKDLPTARRHQQRVTQRCRFTWMHSHRCKTIMSEIAAHILDMAGISNNTQAGLQCNAHLNDSTQMAKQHHDAFASFVQFQSVAFPEVRLQEEMSPLDSLALLSIYITNAQLQVPAPWKPPAQQDETPPAQDHAVKRTAIECKSSVAFERSRTLSLLSGVAIRRCIASACAATSSTEAFT